MSFDSHNVVLELILNKKIARTDCNLYRFCIEGPPLFRTCPHLYLACRRFYLFIYSRTCSVEDQGHPLKYDGFIRILLLYSHL